MKNLIGFVLMFSGVYAQDVGPELLPEATIDPLIQTEIEKLPPLRVERYREFEEKFIKGEVKPEELPAGFSRLDALKEEEQTAEIQKRKARLKETLELYRQNYEADILGSAKFLNLDEEGEYGARMIAVGNEYSDHLERIRVFKMIERTETLEDLELMFNESEGYLHWYRMERAREKAYGEEAKVSKSDFGLRKNHEFRADAIMAILNFDETSLIQLRANADLRNLNLWNEIEKHVHYEDCTDERKCKEANIRVTPEGSSTNGEVQEKESETKSQKGY